MQELRFVAVSEDGRYAVLAVPGRSARFMLPIDERLRAVALGQTSRLAQYEIEVESPLRPKEIQARIRAGETVEEIADAAGIPVERVRWFEGPVLAERAYVADQAQGASVRRHGDSTPGPRLGDVVAERLTAIGADPDGAQWDAKKRGDGSWQVQLTFNPGNGPHVAEWVFDPRRRHVLPADDNAARMSLPGAELPQPAAPQPGEATVTQLAPRLSTAVGQGPAGHGSIAGHGQGNRARIERPGSGRAAGSGPVPSPAAPSAPTPSVSGPSVSGPSVSGPSRSTSAPSAPPSPAPAVSASSGSVPAKPAPPGPAAPAVSGGSRNGLSRHAAGSQDDESRYAAESRTDRPAHVPAAEPPAAADDVTPDDDALNDGPALERPAAGPAGRSSRKAARGKRSSVPSWDEIMFGSSRQND